MYEQQKYVRRGEIYQVRMDVGEGSEQGAVRPGLIISSDGGNATSPLVIVAYLTTRDHNIGIHYGPTKATGRPSYVQCEQLATVSKTRLGRMMGQLSQNEMDEVGNRLDEVLDLGFIEENPLKPELAEKEAECEALRLELSELRTTMAVLQQQQSQHEDELLTRDVEIAVHKRMYEKAVGIIAAMRAEPDLPERPKYQKVETKPTEDQPPVEKKLVDVNTASFTVLRGMGLTNNLILQVINGRPYKAVEDLKNTPGMSSRMYNLIESKICCIPVEQEAPKREESSEEPKKVNLNTCKPKDLREIGITQSLAYKITSDRKKNGPFALVGDVTRVVGIGQKWLDQWIDKLEV